MRPKGKLFALLAIFAAIGLVTATGAFTSVEATRTAEVNVAGDAAALLQLQPHNGPNGFGGGNPTSSQGYAQLTSTNGELQINLAGFSGNVPGSGPNLNATTDVQGVFNITNQGTQNVTVSVDDAGTHEGLVTFYNASSGNAKDSGGLETNPSGSEATGASAELEVGETIVVSIYIDTTGEPTLSGNTQLINNVTVSATST